MVDKSENIDTKIHLLVTGSIDLIRELIKCVVNSNVVVSYFPIMPSEIAVEEQRKTELIEQYLQRKISRASSQHRSTNVNTRRRFRFFSPPRGETAIVQVIPVSQIDVQAAKEQLSKLESKNAILKKLLGPKSERKSKFAAFNVLKTFEDLDDTVNAYGPIHGAFVMTPYSKLLTGGGNVFLSKIVTTLTNGIKSPDAVKPFLCLSKPYPDLETKLVRIDFSQIELAFLHPLVHPAPTQPHLIMVQPSLLTPGLDRSVAHARNFGISIHTLNSITESKSEILDNAAVPRSLLHSAEFTDAIAFLTPLKICLMYQQLFGEEISELGDSNAIVVDAVNEMFGSNSVFGSLFSRVPKSEVAKMEQFSRNIESMAPMTVDILDDLRDERLILQTVIESNANQNVTMPKCKEILRQTKNMDKFFDVPIANPKVEEYCQAIKSYFSAVRV